MRRTPWLLAFAALVDCTSGSGSSGSEAGGPLADAGHDARHDAAPMKADASGPKLDATHPDARGPSSDARLDAPGAPEARPPVETGAVDAPSGSDARGDAKEAGAAPVPQGPTGAWTLAWHDEFNGTAVDDTHWNIGWLTPPKAPGVGNVTAVTDSQQSGTYFGPSAFTFPGDGALHIRLSAPVDPGAPTGFTTRESGLLTTAGLWNLNPGAVAYAGAGKSIDGTLVIEIRARLAGPASDGAAYWPAFWMTNAGNYNGGGQSYSEEVDLLEGLGNGSTGANLQLHLHAASSYGGVSVVPSSAAGTDFSLAFHTYTYLLSTSAIQCWNDGAPIPGVAPSASAAAKQWTVPQYLMLAFQATSGATLPTSATGSPNDLMLDYVRIWTQ